jgi:hypothetical protein
MKNDNPEERDFNTKFNALRTEGQESCTHPERRF